MSDGKRLYWSFSKLDHHILAVDIAGLVEAFTECSAKAHGFLGRTAGDEADNGIACCCARAASGHAPPPPSSVMNSRRFTARCLPCFR
jgi:hypothetical protein